MSGLLACSSPFGLVFLSPPLTPIDGRIVETWTCSPTSEMWSVGRHPDGQGGAAVLDHRGVPLVAQCPNRRLTSFEVPAGGGGVAELAVHLAEVEMEGGAEAGHGAGGAGLSGSVIGDQVRCLQKPEDPRPTLGEGRPAHQPSNGPVHTGEMGPRQGGSALQGSHVRSRRREVGNMQIPTSSC